MTDDGHFNSSCDTAYLKFKFLYNTTTDCFQYNNITSICERVPHFTR